MTDNFNEKKFTATKDGFVLDIEAEKPNVRGLVQTRLEGKLTLGFVNN